MNQHAQGSIFELQEGGHALNGQADIPRLLREVRRRTGLTQEKLAARLGVSFPTLNRWENARSKPSPLALKQIGTLLHELSLEGGDLLRANSRQEERT